MMHMYAKVLPLQRMYIHFNNSPPSMFPNHPICLFAQGCDLSVNPFSGGSCLTLNHSDGSKFDGLLANAGIMARVHHIGYVFVGFWGLRSKQTELQSVTFISPRNYM